MIGVRRLVLLAALVGLSAAPARAQVKEWPAERPPRPLPARDVKFPPYQFRTLANGLQVIAVSHHEQPAVSLRLIVRAGGTQDPDDKPGVAALAAALLDQGTTTRDAEQIASSIDSIGGAIGTGAGSEQAERHGSADENSLRSTPNRPLLRHSNSMSLVLRPARLRGLRVGPNWGAAAPPVPLRSLGTPGLVIAGRFGAYALPEDRARRPVGIGRAR